MIDTRGPSIGFDGSAISRIDGDRLTLDGNLHLRQVHVTGEARFLGAKISGDLDCNGGRFENPIGTAISCDAADIGGYVLLRRANVNGEVCFRAAKIGRNLDLDEGQFENLERTALNCDGADIAGYVLLRRANVAGTTNFLSTSIGRNLECDQSRINNPNRIALNCDSANIGHHVFLRNGFRALGEIVFRAAKLGGNLECAGGRFENAEGRALNCNGAKIEGSVFLREGFHASGTVDLLLVEIRANLDCSGGHFVNPQRVALNCDGAKIKGSVFLRQQFQANGETCFRTATIGVNLECTRGRIDNRSRTALNLDSAVIEGSVFLREKFEAVGGVLLYAAKIRLNLDCSGCQIENSDGYALRCDFAEIGQLRFVAPSQTNGRISLANTRVGVLSDSLDCWPHKSLELDGFRYERISVRSGLDAKGRINWLDKQIPSLLTREHFALQPWTQLAKVLREQGHFRDATEVDIAREDRLRAAGKIADVSALVNWSRSWATIASDGEYTPFHRVATVPGIANLLPWLFHWFYGWFSGYGHRPMRVVYCALAVWFFLGMLYSSAADRGLFAPSTPALFARSDFDCKLTSDQNTTAGNWISCPTLPIEYPRFSAWAYSLDLILPVVHIGQATSWTPITAGDFFSFSHWLRRAIWFEEIFGWVAALTLGAIASGLVKRRDG
ncbi:hypothetical protein F7D13_01295 [Methylocystis rosea]|uniref:Membrane-associated oxidoreductase n=1 Tax=Methylocystis rosea TaxID=173366 RepID=A0ABX6ECX4_9HYPH|nr:hypothetical protein [Methylocystis rosea]QGM92768.1 hypothetical protein F7D13_01295 [Methylocystis rosea]